MNRLKYEIIGWVVLIIVLVILSLTALTLVEVQMGKSSPNESKPPNTNYKIILNPRNIGPIILADPETGCEYYEDRQSQLTPRIASDGTSHKGCNQE